MPGIANVFEELKHIRQCVMSPEERMAHKGQMFFTKGFTNLSGAGSTGIFGFKTPDTDKIIHARAQVYGEAEFTVEIWEGATVPDTGAAVIPFNCYRDSPKVPELSPYANPEVTNSGTMIWAGKLGSGKYPSTVAPGLNYEIIPKRDSHYLWKITKESAQEHYIDYDFFWYEDGID